MPVPHDLPGSLTLESGLTARAAVAVRRLRTSGEVHVWCWELPARTDPDDLALLSTQEYERVLSFHQERDAAAFVRSHAAARRAVGELLGVPASEVAFGRRDCPGCGDTGHGPPSVTRPAVPLAISLSRTAGRGVLAVRAGTRVGVDIEALRGIHSQNVVDMVTTEAERAVLQALTPGDERDRAFHRVWTRKEAVVKAVGVGLIGTELNELDVRADRTGRVEVQHTFQGRHTLWAVEDLDVGPDWTACVARPADTATGPVRLHPVQLPIS
ncbi:4'-phosphopantetheinyl transferase family protein [Streptomyces sp. NPDC048340]|uniref:4'-phosphopantetheinyl transferase family protein n=1 Tax=Streptomyces sp. NPDC048340 TaxID=3365537 RepID=UPI00371FBE7C